MEHYVTLFDRLFLPQGLALYQSIKTHAPGDMLWVLCLDEVTKKTLDNIGDVYLRTISLSDVETRDLLEIKPYRSLQEYYWTLTPFAPGFVFARDSSVKRVTYLDADVFFFKSPRPIIEEFESSGKSVLLTEHVYDEDSDQTANNGIFCVQFMTFVRDSSEPVRQWWAERCLEWCYSRNEDGKFGDQKYLDDWPVRFAEFVHVLQVKSAIQAPWNTKRFSCSDAIAWHFQGLRIQGKQILWYEGYEISRNTQEKIYKPYINQLESILNIHNLFVVQKKPQSKWFSMLITAKYILLNLIFIRHKRFHRKLSKIRFG